MGVAVKTVLLLSGKMLCVIPRGQVGHIACMGEVRKAHKPLLENIKEKVPLGGREYDNIS
jgi:hypothetical protein